jgi:hypothetical protein
VQADEKISGKVETQNPDDESLTGSQKILYGLLTFFPHVPASGNLLRIEGFT